MIKNLNYELVGQEDPTIVFLHGWGLSGSSFDGVKNRLTRNQKVLKLDFFSFGKSDSAEEWFDTYEYAYHVFLLLNELGISRIKIVGHSFGGRIAIILASIFNVSVSAMVLTSSAGLNRFNLIKTIKIKYYKIIKFLANKKIISKQRLQKYGSSDYKKLDDLTKKVFVKVVNQDLLFLIKKIKCKSYLIWDKKDNITQYWICKKLYKSLMKPSKVMFNSGKHFAYLYNIDEFSKIVNNI